METRWLLATRGRPARGTCHALELEEDDDEDDLEGLNCLVDRTLVQDPRRCDEGAPLVDQSVRRGQTMARIMPRDCECLVPTRYERVLLAGELVRGLSDLSSLAREPDRMREAKAVTARRRIAERAADPEILRINVWRRRWAIRLPGESNDTRPSVDAGGEAQAG